MDHRNEGCGCFYPAFIYLEFYSFLFLEQRTAVVLHTMQRHLQKKIIMTDIYEKCMSGNWNKTAEIGIAKTAMDVVTLYSAIMKVK